MGCLCFCKDDEENKQQQQETADKPKQPKTCCAQVGWHQRQFKMFYLIGLSIGMVVGIVLVVVGITYIVNGEKSTVGQEYYSRLGYWYRNDFPDWTDTTVTSPDVPTGFTRVQTPLTWNLVGANGTDTRSYQNDVFVGLAPRPASGDLQMTLNFVQTNGTLVIPNQDPVTTAAYPVTNATTGGATLTSACVVIKHEAHNGPWLLGDEESCFYPFTADAARQYSLTPSGTDVIVILVSSFNPVLYLEKTAEGAFPDVPDADIILVDPNTPTFFGAGAAIFVICLLWAIYFCCCVVQATPDEVAPWE